MGALMITMAFDGFPAAWGTSYYVPQVQRVLFSLVSLLIPCPRDHDIRQSRKTGLDRDGKTFYFRINS